MKQNVPQSESVLLSIKDESLGAREMALQLKSEYCSYRGPDFGSQDPGGSQSPVTVAPGDLMPSPGILGYVNSHTRNSYTHIFNFLNKIFSFKE